jgi:phosphatidylinositol alpha-1,6-mannosyltransferase
LLSHLLVTNDFPPKLGGIQSYLWELWRRLPPEQVTVLTTPQAGDREFDRAQAFHVERTPEPVLLPTPGLARRIRRLAAERGAALVVLDPALPLGLLAPSLGIPYAVVLHGAEASIPARLPVARSLLRRVLRDARLVVAAGAYVLSEARRVAPHVPAVVVPPGVDVGRFKPLLPEERLAARAAHRIDRSARVVVSVTRLVPRKGVDVLIAAASLLARDRPDLALVVAGWGRDSARLHGLVAATGAPVRLLGRVADAALPGLVGCADVFAMPCRNRWFGLEQEGFGIVFLEAAACGVPQVAGASGGAAEAVAHGETGFVVNMPDDPVAVADALATLLDDADARAALGNAARLRAESDFDYDHLASALGAALGAALG